MILDSTTELMVEYSRKCKLRPNNDKKKSACFIEQTCMTAASALRKSKSTFSAVDPIPWKSENKPS